MRRAANSRPTPPSRRRKPRATARAAPDRYMLILVPVHAPTIVISDATRSTPGPDAAPPWRDQIRRGIVWFAVLFGLTASACVHERGQWRTTPALDTTARSGIEIVAIGNVHPGRAARQLAERLAESLAPRPDGTRPIVIWVGDLGATRRHGTACRDLDRTWQRRGLRQLAAVVGRHVADGGASFAVLGPDDRRCDVDRRVRRIWQHPGVAYVVRVHHDGSAHVVSNCDSEHGTCSIAAADPTTVVELVVIDHPPEHSRVAASSPRPETAALLDALPRDDTPRLLVLARAVESAGPAGHGGRIGDSSFRRVVAPVREAIIEGRFVGVVSGGDAALQFVDDGSDAIRRSARRWPQRPQFHVVATGSPRSRLSPTRMLDRLPQRRGLTVVPDLTADGSGFAVLRIDDDRVDVRLHDHTRWRWRTSNATTQLVRAAHTHEGPAPAMHPCLRCPEREIDVAKTSPKRR